MYGSTVSEQTKCFISPILLSKLLVIGHDFKMDVAVVILTLLINHSNCEIDVFKDVENSSPWTLTQKMPTIYRNLLLLKEDCGEVCDTSDRFVKKPGKYFDVIKKEFECDFLLESSSLYQELIIDEQMIKQDKKEYQPPR